MSLQPWYKVIVPREDLRDGRPLDASEFAVHLDKVRDGTAPEDYKNPKRFFDRTYLTANLLAFSAEVIRRLSGITTETSAVFNLATQFGGGKTHALTLLWHLAAGGRKTESCKDVDKILSKAVVDKIPRCEVATFVGTEFDSVTGRGGKDGTPLRHTPWGEIAWQLGGAESFAAVAEHDKRQTAPAGDVIRKMLPKNRASLILMDELINYVSRNRKSGLSTQLYDFVQNLSETARGESNIVLAVSVPASELEMTSEDQADYARFKKLLDRLGKAVVMSAEDETSEIIRRRLFDWNELPQEGKKVAVSYADWIVEHREQLPKWFPVDTAKESIEASYPFHPTVLSVFERKWQALPRFQQTRGILRLLALWVSSAYNEGYKGAHKDPLIGLGTAPLEDTLFRTAVFEQLGEQRLEGAVTTDICGKKGSHAMRLDAEALAAIKKARLHKKVATVVFFESNGGQAKEGIATIPEIRLAVAEPGLDIGNVETALEALSDACYFLRVEKTRYLFSLKPNLNKILADRKATVGASKIEEQIRAETIKAFQKQPGVDVVYFPEKSIQLPDKPMLTLVVLGPANSINEKRTTEQILGMIAECGSSGRTFKSALLFSVVEDDNVLRDEARKMLAWQAIKDEEDEKLDTSQKTQLMENLKRAQHDLKESVWRAYKNLVLLAKDNTLKKIDLGLVHSSQADSMTKLITERLRQDSDIEPYTSPNYLVKHWPPAFTEWSTKAVRNAFFASPEFPRLLNGDSIKETIAKGVSNGILGYVGKGPKGYDPFKFECPLAYDDVEISEEMFIITAAEAKKHKEPAKLTSISIEPEFAVVKPGDRFMFKATGLDQHGRPLPLPTMTWGAKGGTIDVSGVFAAGEEEGAFEVICSAGGLSIHATVQISIQKESTKPVIGPKGLRWRGEVPAQKWMNFYTKVLSKHATAGALRIEVGVEVKPKDGIQPQHEAEMKAALKELGLSDVIEKIE